MVKNLTKPTAPIVLLIALTSIKTSATEIKCEQSEQGGLIRIFANIGLLDQSDTYNVCLARTANERKKVKRDQSYFATKSTDLQFRINLRELDLDTNNLYNIQKSMITESYSVHGDSQSDSAVIKNLRLERLDGYNVIDN